MKMNKWMPVLAMSLFMTQGVLANDIATTTTLKNVLEKSAACEVMQMIEENNQSETEMLTMTQDETSLCEKTSKKRKWSAMWIGVPIVALIAATGGLAAIPLATGAASAEVAMGAALALAIL